MPALTRSALRDEIAARRTAALYMLVGDDDVEKSEVANEFVGIVEEGLEAFNVERLHGGEIAADALIDAASQLPMMSARRLVLVFDASRLLMPKRESKTADADLARLEAFLEAPPSHATVVFVCGPLDERRRTVKALRRSAVVVDCGTIEDEAGAAGWVRARAARAGAAFTPDAVGMLVERAGLDLTRLRAAVDRVIVYALGQPAVTAEDVRQAVVAAPEAHADFGIAKAIWRNDTAGALKELSLALDGGAVPFMLMGQLRAAAEKLPDRRVGSAINAVIRTDLALKSSGGDARVLLERLVLELCVSGPPQKWPAGRG